MSYTANARTESTPEFWHEAGEHSRKIAQAVNGILNGLTNNTFSVTLTAGETTSTVSFPPARNGGSALLFPQNAAAATLARVTDVYATTTTGEVVITHGSAAGGEQFSLVIVT